jgi:galactonate dehydratase
MVVGALEHDGHGFLVVPEKPGIGVELAEDAAERHPYRMRWVGTRLHADGSVVDQ